MHFTQFGSVSPGCCTTSVFYTKPLGAAEGQFEVKDKYSTWGMEENFFIFPPRVFLPVQGFEQEIFLSLGYHWPEKIIFYRKATVKELSVVFLWTTVQSQIPIMCYPTFAEALNILGFSLVL